MCKRCTFYNEPKSYIMKVLKNVKLFLAMIFFLGFVSTTVTSCGGEKEGEETEQSEESEGETSDEDEHPSDEEHPN